jgi:phage-related protein
VKELGEQWMPKLKAAFDKVREAVEPIVRKIVDFIRTNPKPFIMGLAAAIGVVLVGAIGAAVVALGGIIFSVGGLIALFGAAVAAIAYFWQESETFRYVVTRVFEDVKAVVTPIINGIIETVQHLVDAFAGLITFLRGVFTGDFGMVMDGIKALFTGFYDAITSILETIQNAFVAFFSLDAVQTAIKYSLDKIMDFIRAIPDRVGKLAVGAFDALKTAFRSVLNWIIDKWNSIDFGFNIEIPSWVPGIGGKGFGIEDVIPDIPNIGGPTLLAPSAMLPSTALREATTTPTVINNINVTAPNVDPDSLISGLRRYNRSSGDAPVNIGFY